MLKRLFDFIFSFIGLIVCLPIFAIVAVVIKIDSPGSVFFHQIRIGRNFKPFIIYKFRTMVEDACKKGPLITSEEDKRITRVGKILRKTKIDELPQLINVFKGDMSFVGPRPEVSKYANFFKGKYAKILSVRPGITDMASIKYKNEGNLLSQGSHLKELYTKIILPDKLEIHLEYVNSGSSLKKDIVIILKTLKEIVFKS